MTYPKLAALSASLPDPIGPDCTEIHREAVECYRELMRAQADTVEAAARALIAKLDVCHADGQYEGVWTMYYVHGGRYTGPTYEHELAALRALLPAQGEVMELTSPEHVAGAEALLRAAEDYRRDVMDIIKLHAITGGDDKAADEADAANKWFNHVKALIAQPAHGERQAPTYWLIERNQKHGEPSARWFSERIARAGGEQDLWVQDVTRAERFSSKEEAERSIQKRFTDEDEDRYPVLPEATEHIDLAGPNLRDGEGQYHSFADGYNSGIARGIAEGLERAAKLSRAEAARLRKLAHGSSFGKNLSLDTAASACEELSTAIRSLAPAKQPDAEGGQFVVVPREPTPEMLRAGCALAGEALYSEAEVLAIWQDMLAALPTVPEGKS